MDESLLAAVRADDKVDDGNWPMFRGPRATGVAAGDNLPDQWSATENVEWKVEIPGRGWSSPIVWGNRIFLTTVVNTGQTAESKKGLYLKGEQRDPVDAQHLWKVLCLDLVSGKLLWEQTAHEGKPVTPLHTKNTYASETPVTDGKQVYAYFGNLGVFCYDVEGKFVWSKTFEPHAMRLGWGTAASPTIHESRLYIVNDNEEDSYAEALDTANGKELWRVERDEQSNWATPFVWKNELRTELVTAGTNRVRSYDLDGKLLWDFEGMSVITIATPFAQNGLLYISSGYVLDMKRKPVYAIRPGGKGDITLAAGSNSNETIAWCQRNAGPYNPSVLVYGERMYVLYDRGLMACYNALTGAEIYEKQRIPNGRAFTASPWAFGGKIFCLSEYGETFVFAASDEMTVLRRQRGGRGRHVPGHTRDRRGKRIDSQRHAIVFAKKGEVERHFRYSGGKVRSTALTPPPGGSILYDPTD